MLKTIAAIRRRAGMSRAEFVRYYRDVHGEIARQKPLGVARYVQNDVTEAVYGVSGDRAILTGTARNAVTELYFADAGTMQSTFADPYVREVVGPDGVNFSDLQTAISLVAREEGKMPVLTGSKVKAMWFLKAHESISGEAFDDQWRSGDAALHGFDMVVGTVRNHRLRVPEADRAASYFGGKDVISYDGVHCAWLASATAVDAMHGYTQAMSRQLAGYLDSSRSFWLLVNEREIFAQENPV